MDAPSFIKFSINTRMLMDYQDNTVPSQLHGWEDLTAFHQKASTYFGYVYQGRPTIKSQFGNFELQKGMYFSVPDAFEIEGGKGMVIERLNYEGTFMLGGPVEQWGRLKYIDGCTDSLLISPVKKGDPCLNALYFPTGIFQTQHTHPSFRMGMVIEGKGTCVTPSQHYPLDPGDIFIIPEDSIHSFKTSDMDSMTVIAFHPDSDFGPEDENHPMINRTIVDGKSAKEISSILTK